MSREPSNLNLSSYRVKGESGGPISVPGFDFHHSPQSVGEAQTNNLSGERKLAGSRHHPPAPTL